MFAIHTTTVILINGYSCHFIWTRNINRTLIATRTDRKKPIISTISTTWSYLIRLHRQTCAVPLPQVFEFSHTVYTSFIIAHDVCVCVKCVLFENCCWQLQVHHTLEWTQPPQLPQMTVSGLWTNNCADNYPYRITLNEWTVWFI